MRLFELRAGASHARASAVGGYVPPSPPAIGRRYSPIASLWWESCKRRERSRVAVVAPGNSPPPCGRKVPAPDEGGRR
jgi:hypothetical protein